MEPSRNSNSLKRRSLADEDEDANISTFRRRNKIIAAVFILLIISLTLLIAALIIQLRRSHKASSSHKSVGFPPILDFCSFSSAPTCLATLNPIITHKLITDPNQIFTLSLQTAAKHIQHLINTSLSNAPNSSFNSCSNSLRGGLGRIRESLATVRVDPFVESLSNEQRVAMKNRIVAAEEDVESCLDYLAAGEMTAKLVDVQVCLISAVDFLDGYTRMRPKEIDLYLSIIAENLCVWGLQLLFIFCLFCSLFRIR
ncbi:hypothetical protein C2S52_018760 [Perilla frutescens var. hirtella]|nr:hypothetical protein C2S52_018760 [Perilla frutescens var. hirtella]